MVLLVGYGNVLRGDDGVGIYVVRQLEKLFSNIKVLISQQLNLEMLEEMVRFEEVILVDASQEKGNVTFRKIEVCAPSSMIASHHLRPELLCKLGMSLYKKEIAMYVCSIPAEKFDVGEEISKETLTRADKAIATISAFLLKGEKAYA